MQQMTSVWHHIVPLDFLKLSVGIYCRIVYRLTDLLRSFMKQFMRILLLRRE